MSCAPAPRTRVAASQVRREAVASLARQLGLGQSVAEAAASSRGQLPSVKLRMKHEATLLHELPALAAHRSPTAFASHSGCFERPLRRTCRRNPAFRLDAGGVANRPRRAGRDLSRQAPRDCESLPSARRRMARSSCPINPLLEAGSGRVHPARLRRARPGHVGRAARALARCWPTVPLLPMSSSSARRPRCAGRKAVTGCIPGLRCSTRTAGGHRVIDTDMVAHPVHLRQHRQAERRRAVAPQHGRRREERRVVSGKLSQRRASGGAALVVRRRLQPADDGVPCRRQRSAAELPAAEGRGQRAVARAPRDRHSPRCRRSGSSSTQVTWPAAVADASALFREHRRPDAAARP